MSAKIRLLGERPATQLTFKWTLAGVSTYMHPQHAVVGEPSATHKADKPAAILHIVAGIVATHVFVKVAALRE